MTRSTSHAWIRIACAAATLALALAPGVAHATGPSLSDQQIMNEGFEGASPANLVLDWVAPSPATPYPAYWGPITQQKHTGLRGLWCAGLIPDSSSTTAWTTFGGKYPDYTAGLATFALPELADYYSATLDYWYRMPTIGSADGDSFVAEWSSAGGGPWDYHTGLALTSTWTHISLDMTVPNPGVLLRPVNLSRTPGQVRFRFIDDTSVYNESPTTGEGPTIDDVTVSGYRYGPVRGLHTSSVSADSVGLAWTRPARSTAIGAADDTRTVLYRVWRSPDFEPYSWTEVSGAGVSGTAFVDSSPGGGNWRYVVQACDPVPGLGYGQVDTGAGVSIATPFQLHYSQGANGTIGGAPTQAVFYNGSGTAVTAVPNPGYHFTGWSDGVLTAARTDSGVTTDLFVSAAFAVNTYTLTYTPGAHGTISGTSPQTVNYNASGTVVTAVPGAGYHFVNWSDGKTTAARTDSPVVSDVTVTANFAINTYALTYTAGAHGTISGTSPQTVNHNGSGSAVTAVPNTGYHFVSWSDGVLTAARTDSGVTHAIDVTADFAVNAVDSFTLFYAAGPGGAISGTSPQTVTLHGSGTTVTAVPSVGYHFVAWNDGILTIARTDSDVTADKSVLASFAINTYTLTYTGGTHGAISGTSPQTVDHNGSGTAVTAVPNVGYHFLNWSDGGTTAARTDGPVVGNVTVTADFAINTYTLTYTAGVNGTISGTSPQTVDHGGSGTPVTAVPNPGYHFVSWNDDVMKTATRMDTGISGPLAVVAGFALGEADTTPPSTTWAGAAATFVTKTTIVLSATDVYGSGVAETWYKLDTGAVTKYGTPVAVTKAGAHALDYWSVDKAGNIEAHHHVHFTVLIGTYVSITSNHTSITHKHPVVFSGHISTTQPTNTHVYVYVKKPGSHTWVYLSTRHTTSTHHWSYSYAPSYKGTWYFQVRFKGTSRYAASHSTDRRITVR